PPIILVNREIPADSQRFTMTHEVVHSIMHLTQNSEIAGQADGFAYDFFMPARDIKSSLKQLALQKMATLKEEWHVSMNAILKRSQDLGQISDRYARTL